MTFPLDVGDLPGGDRDREEVPTELHFNEGTAIGYRSEAVRRHGALFPFGFGLSYSDTSHRVVNSSVRDGHLTLQIEVSNSSDRTACHVVQLYAEVDGKGDRELVGVIRTPLGPRETTHAESLLPSSALARWNDAVGRRMLVDGRHLLRIATSSADSGHAFAVSVEHGAITEVRDAEES